ncbi:MAG: YqgE/AlgH family protein [Gammaproteobacteria bacterium]|nr:YqgE/AlgH family protein [Gammaproteobacteria bacterium]
MAKAQYNFIPKPALLVAGLLLFIPVLFADSAVAEPTENNLLVKKGVFLVAKRKLHGTRFQKTVILITHYSEKEVMGFAINRPTDIPLNQAFPDVGPLKHNTDLIYLGGPVRPKTMFVLLRTKQPKKGMHHIVDDVYFSSVKDAFSPSSHKITRTYAGFSGWTARQLQNEINRGDWQIVHTDPAIIFDENTSTLWQRLFKKWSGSWT